MKGNKIKLYRDFASLLDTPSSYTGEGLKALRVNAAGDGIEFYTPSAGSGIVASVVGGTDITVDNTDPANPIVNWTGLHNAYTGSNGVSLVGSDFQHEDTSSVVNISPAPNKYVDGLTFDTFGHVLTATTATFPSTSYVYNSSFNIGTGDITLSVLNQSDVIQNLDGRYSLLGHTHVIADVTDFTDNSTNWDTAYSNMISSLTTNGTAGAATLIGGVLNIPIYGGAGAGGQVDSVVGGTDITVDNTDPVNPIVNFTGTYFTPTSLLVDYSFTDNSTNWNNAFGWGDHSTVGYLESFTRANSTFINLIDSGTATNPILTASLSATGTPDSTKYLRGDNIWETIPAVVTDHTLLTNIGTNTHTQIDSHIDVSNEVLSTGLNEGGVLSINAGDSSKFDISAGNGIIVDHTISPPTYIEVSWTAFTAQTLVNLATSFATDIAINSAGAIVQQNSFTDEEVRNLIFLGGIDHNNQTTISNTFPITVPTKAVMSSVRELSKAIGDINLNGNIYSPNGVNLNIDKSGGSVFSYGRNYLNDVDSPHKVTTASQLALSFGYVFNDGFSNGSFTTSTTSIDPDQYDDGSGTLATVSPNKWTIQRILFFPNANKTFIQYGVTTYNKLEDALNAVPRQEFIALAGIRTAMVRGYLIVKKGETDLNNATFLSADRFGNVASLSSGLDASLAELTDTIITSPTSGEIIVWDGAGWVNNTFAEAGIITDHTGLTNIGTNSHVQIDSHIADASIHFTENPNWNTAFSWGDHDGLYLPIGTQLAQTKALVAGEYFTSYNAVTGLFTSATPPNDNDNYYLTGLGFNTSTGLLTATVDGAANPTVDLDGRYALLNTFDNNAALTGAFVYDNVIVQDGLVTGITTRTLTLANLGYTGDSNANEYTHPNHSGDVVSSGDGVTTIQAGAVDIPMLSATGTPSASTYLRGDNTWATITGGGSGTVTSVTAGAGMTQTGVSTVNPTLNVIAGAGILVNADDVELDITSLTATTNPANADRMAVVDNIDNHYLINLSDIQLTNFENNLSGLTAGNGLTGTTYDGSASSSFALGTPDTLTAATTNATTASSHTHQITGFEKAHEYGNKIVSSAPTVNMSGTDLNFISGNVNVVKMQINATYNATSPWPTDARCKFTMNSTIKEVILAHAGSITNGQGTYTGTVTFYPKDVSVTSLIAYIYQATTTTPITCSALDLEIEVTPS